MTSNQANPLQILNAIEEDLAESLSAAGQALKEASKDKPNQKAVETSTNLFMQRLDRAGNELSQQIAYLARVTTSQSAESSSYGCRKDTNLPKNRLQHARYRLADMESFANKRV